MLSYKVRVVFLRSGIAARHRAVTLMIAVELRGLDSEGIAEFEEPKSTLCPSVEFLSPYS